MSQTPPRERLPLDELATAFRGGRETLVVKTGFWMALAVAFIVTFDTAEVQAQLFGKRVLGRTLRRQPGPADQVGELDAADRFLRGNRSATDFVGSDAGEVGDFVGRQESANLGSVRSAAESLRPAEETDVNRRQNKPRSTKSRPYPARLRIDFSYNAPPPSSISTALEDRIQRLEGLDSPGQVEVRIQGRTAILQGEVASMRSRILAEQLARLEPGIARVQNDLTVVGSLPEPERTAP